MNKFILYLLFTLFIHSFFYSQDSINSIVSNKFNLDFSIGIKTTTAANTANLRSINRSIHYLIDDRIAWMKRRDKKQVFLKATSRFLRYAAIDRQISFNIMLYNHEVFGHVASLNDLNFTFSAYYQPIYFYLTRKYTKKFISVFLNFDKDNYQKVGFPTVFSKINSNYNYHPTQYMSMAASGLMAENLYHIDCQEQWVKNNTIPYSDATAYIETSIDNFRYILVGDEYGYGGDMGNYLFNLNMFYNPSIFNNGNYIYESVVPLIGEKFKIKSSDFHRANYLTAFSDPNFYFSLFSIGNYIIRGESYTRLPLLRLGKVKFMPAISLVLAPFGLEYNLRTPLVFPNKKMHLQFRFGEAYGRNYFGLGLKLSNLVCKKDFVLSPHFEVFSQPKMYFGNSKSSNEPYQKIGGNGFIADVLIEKKIPSSPMYLSARIGYKTAGFVLGESLKATPIIQFGFGTELTTLRKNKL